MPTPTIPAGNLFMNATLYTGTGTTQTITNGVAGQSFAPDFVWIKDRNAIYQHNLYDSVRGVTNALESNSTSAAYTLSGLTAFNSNGFSLGSNAGNNNNGNSLVAWQWKAGGTAVSNTSGSITSQVSANTTAGFSVVTYTGVSGSTNSVGHGLGITPAMIIVKDRTNAVNWAVWHTGLPSGTNVIEGLNTTAAASNQNCWTGSSSGTYTPNSSTFSVGGSGNMTNNSSSHVAYCWAPIAGYSAFGSYTGNGSADGPFVYLGFRPRFIMFKVTNTTDNWYLFDSSRETYNIQTPNRLFPNLSNAEDSAPDVDFLSNGFKCRTAGGGINTNTNNYIYAAFAENPFKYSNAR